MRSWKHSPPFGYLLPPAAAKGLWGLLSTVAGELGPPSAPGDECSTLSLHITRPEKYTWVRVSLFSNPEGRQCGEGSAGPQEDGTVESQSEKGPRGDEGWGGEREATKVSGFSMGKLGDFKRGFLLLHKHQMERLKFPQPSIHSFPYSMWSQHC